MRRRVLIIVLGLTLVSLFSAAPALACDDCRGCDYRSPGYWMNHPCDWPSDRVCVGGTWYGKCEAIRLMGMPGGDKGITMFRALVAAKLNVAAGCPSCSIACTICRADEWMACNWTTCTRVAASSCAGKIGEYLYWRLDAYNNGYLTCCCGG